MLLHLSGAEDPRIPRRGEGGLDDAAAQKSCFQGERWSSTMSEVSGCRRDESCLVVFSSATVLQPLTRSSSTSNPPQVIFICAATHLDPDHDFDGEIGIWRVCVHQGSAEDNREPPGRGMISGLFLNGLLPVVKEKTPSAETLNMMVQDGAALSYRQRDPSEAEKDAEGAGEEYQP